MVVKMVRIQESAFSPQGSGWVQPGGRVSTDTPLRWGIPKRGVTDETEPVGD